MRKAKLCRGPNGWWILFQIGARGAVYPCAFPTWAEAINGADRWVNYGTKAVQK